MTADHSDLEDMNGDEEFPIDEDDITDSDQEWPQDSDSELDDDEDDGDERARGTEQPAPRASSYNYNYLILVVGVVLIAALPVWFQSPNGFALIKDTFQSGQNSDNAKCKSALGKNERLFTKTELAKYSKKPKILLGFLGVVYDVTNGQYYHPDGSYHFFAGIDGTRGFLTGEFTPDELVDDISDLDQSYFSGIDTWLNLYDEKYERVGLVIGAYYDAKGCETRKLRQVLTRIEQSKESVDEDKAEQEKYPPCNSEWNATEKRGRVWCTKLSGGISRSWVGQPRQFYALGTKSWRCACVQHDSEVTDWCDQTTAPADSKAEQKSPGVKYAQGETTGTSTPNCLFKHYPNCDPTATECPFQD